MGSGFPYANVVIISYIFLRCPMAYMLAKRVQNLQIHYIFEITYIQGKCVSCSGPGRADY
jgi:hypothetical protein